MDTNQLKHFLNGLPLGEIQFAETVGSTNDIAMDRAVHGVSDFSLYVADQQTAGRGRLQRQWVTNPGAALAFSLVILPKPEELDILPLFSPLGAVAVSLALEELGLQPQIKWPNDVLVGGRKMTGILLESNWSGDRIGQLVIGIGVNVTPAAVPSADQVRFPATCIEDALGHSVDRWALLRAIVAQMVAWRARLHAAEFRQAWQSRLAFRNEWVRVGTGLDEGQLGLLQGVDEAGNLLLLDRQGQPFTVHVGEVSLRKIDD